MNDTLWIRTSEPRSAGPWNRRITPLTNTTTVVSTTIGAITRSSGSGGPLRR